MRKPKPTTEPPFVARWHSDEGHFTVLAMRTPKGLQVLVHGYPMALVTLPAAAQRHLVPLDYPVRKAVRMMRAMAVNNATDRVRRFLELAKGALGK